MKRPKRGGEVRPKRPWWKRLLLLAAWVLMGWIGLTVCAVLLFRFAPVPFSAYMAERRVAAWFTPNSNYRSLHTWVSLDQIAPCMGLAVIAGEDQTFAEHSGFDWASIEKAMEHNEKSHRKRGASTISQQTAKNLFLWSSRSWVRKGFEVYFTVLIEGGWSKRRILEVYLNIAEFGDGIYGVEAASKKFFGKSAQRLSPSEAALLAAVLPSPRRFRADAPSPYVRGRQAWILNQMRQLGGDAVVKELGE